ncbi:hypothetical protein [Arenimonas donghaensis]|uniref:Uncharacterized protein n=1 Tax=Arenimonas donghaensis DSM 18148 = HO3-R19 TaxID=1121014 RepID=A0A087MIY4_9GAMM|nr:hypothetical protein [Arenimonas donghaensis]KFL36837.1 hypothetical protein N788_04265 [Arenimonas donghaensis DSM 18148 = HO3-R19]
MAARRWLLGCLLTLLVLLVLAVATWWFVLRPMWNAGVEGAKTWISAVDLGDDIVNQAPYEPPADGRMTAAQVESFVRVQQVVAAEMGPDLARLAHQSQAAASEHASGRREPTIQDLGNVFGEASGLLSRVRAAQARGVNQVGMSREEYAWVRRQSLAAMSELLPVPDAGTVAGMAGLPGLPAFKGPDADDEVALAAARHNAELLRPHLPLLHQTLGAMPALP